MSDIGRQNVGNPIPNSCQSSRQQTGLTCSGEELKHIYRGLERERLEIGPLLREQGWFLAGDSLNEVMSLTPPDGKLQLERESPLFGDLAKQLESFFVSAQEIESLKFETESLAPKASALQTRRTHADLGLRPLQSEGQKVGFGEDQQGASGPDVFASLLGDPLLQDSFGERSGDIDLSQTDARLSGKMIHLGTLVGLERPRHIDRLTAHSSGLRTVILSIQAFRQHDPQSAPELDLVVR